MPSKHAQRPDELEPIERASRDELRALQLARLHWSLTARLRATCRTTARRSTPQGVHPRRPAHARGPRALPVHGQDRPARQLSVRHVRGAARAGRAHPRVVGHDRQADGRRLHAQGHRHLGHRDGALDPRRRRRAPATSCTSPTATASSPAASARTTAPRSSGCTVIPMSRRQTEKQVQLIADFKPDDHHGHAVVHAGDRRGDGAAGHRSDDVARSRSASSAPSRGRRRCAQAIESAARHRRDRHLRPVGGDGPGRRAGMHRDQGRPHDLGGPLLSRDHRPGDGRGAARRREGRARVHVAHQGGAADHPLPHARPHAPAAAAPRARCAAWRRSPAAPTT